MSNHTHTTTTQPTSRPILTVGSVAFDSVKTPFGEVSRVVAERRPISASRRRSLLMFAW